MGRDAPPCLFAEAAHSIDNVAYEAAFPLHDLGHDEGSQLTALLKAEPFVVDAVAGDLVFGEDRPRQYCPRLTDILFSICDIALAHLHGDGVAPERIISLRQQTGYRQAYR